MLLQMIWFCHFGCKLHKTVKYFLCTVFPEYMDFKVSVTDVVEEQYLINGDIGNLKT